MYRTVLLAVLLALSLSGCIKSHTVMKLKPDGSGTIERVQMMSKTAGKSLASPGTPDGVSARDIGEQFTEEKAKADAAKLGSGVAFVSAQKVTEGDYEGLKAIYSFKDVTKIKLDEGMPNRPEEQMDEVAKKAKDAEMPKITFGKSAAGNSLLTITFPKHVKKEQEKKTPEQQTQESAMFKMMAPMFKGMHISQVIEVDGKLVKTTSPFVAGSKVTLMDIPLGEIFANPDLIAKLTANEPETNAEMAKLLAAVPGAKIVPTQEVTIEFTK